MGHHLPQWVDGGPATCCGSSWPSERRTGLGDPCQWPFQRQEYHFGLCEQNTQKRGSRTRRQSRKQGANRQKDTLFLQNRKGVLKVQVAVTSFPVVAAPPAPGGAPRPFCQVWEQRSPVGDGSRAPGADGWRRSPGNQDGREGRDDRRGQRIRHPPKIKQQDGWKRKEKMRIRH